MFAFSVHSLSIFLVVAFVAYALIAGGIPAAFAAVHVICGGARHATAGGHRALFGDPFRWWIRYPGDGNAQRPAQWDVWSSRFALLINDKGVCADSQQRPVRRSWPQHVA